MPIWGPDAKCQNCGGDGKVYSNVSVAFVDCPACTREALFARIEALEAQVAALRRDLAQVPAKMWALRDALKQQVNVLTTQECIVADRQSEAVLAETAAAAEQHDARIRAEGRREGLEEAVAALQAYIDSQKANLKPWSSWHYEWQAAMKLIRDLVDAPKET